MTLFRDSQAELDELLGPGRRAQAAEVRVGALSDADAQILASDLVSYARAYPDLDAGVAYELASNGVPATDPLAAEVASEDAAFQSELLFNPGAAFGQFAGDVKRQLDAVAPYERLLEIVGNHDDGINLEKVARLPASYVGQVLAAYDEGEFDNDGQVILRVNDALEDEYGDDWRNVLVRMSQEDELVRRKAVAAELLDPEAAKDLVSGAATRAESPGFGIGSVTRPVIAALSSGQQFVTNRFRQGVGDYLGGIQTAASQQAFGGGGGQVFGQRTLGNPSGLTTEGQAGLRAAGGAVTAAVYAGGVGAALGGPGPVVAGAALAGFEAASGGVSASGVSQNVAEAARATDLSVFVEQPGSRGDGILLGSDLMQERLRREEALAPAMKNGELVTFGRAFASGVGFDLDSRPYNTLSGLVDFSVALVGPGEIGAEGATALARGGRALPGVRSLPVVGKFDPLIEAGALPTRKSGYVIRPTAEAWLDSWRGRKVTDALADMDSVDDVMRAFDGKVSVHVARDLAHADDSTRVTDILKEEIGIGVRSTPALGGSALVPGTRATLRGATTFSARAKQQSRLLSRLSDDLPQTDEVDLMDLDGTYRWASSYLANASVPRSEAKEILERLAYTTYAERMPFVMNEIAAPVYQNTFEQLVRRRMNSVKGRAGSARARRFGDEDALLRWNEEVVASAAERANRLTSHFIERMEGLSLYHIDGGGMPGVNPLAVTKDGVSRVQSPHLIVEQLHGKMPVPGIGDLRELRRLNAPLYSLLSRPMLAEASKLATGSRAILEAATSSWKPLVLLRAAYIMRVVGEEQLRIAAAGGDSIANNPVAWLGWVVTRGGRNLDLTGKNMKETQEFLGVQLGSGKLKSPREAYKMAKDQQIARATVYARVGRGEPGFERAWAGEIAQLARDDVAKFVADAGGVTDDLVREALEKFGDEFESLALRTEGSDFASAWTNGDRRDAVWYYLSSIDERIRVKTGGNAELRQAIVDGKIVRNEREVKLRGGGSNVPESRLVASDDFIKIVTDEFADFAPDQVKGVKQVTSRTTQGVNEAMAMYQTVLDIMGAAIIEAPTSKFSRSPTFLQSYWNFAEENAHLLNRSGAEKLRKMLDSKSMNPSRLEQSADFLRRVGFDPDPAKIRKRINTIADRADGDLPLAEFDLLAKGHAMDATNDLLFNMATKKQWQDSARIIAPFAAAWQEVITRWGKLLAENPNIPRRVQQMHTALREEDLAETLDQWGANTIDGSGLIYTDDYGQEVVVIPWIFGNQPMSVPLSSLSQGASFLPGIGPAAALPVNWLLPDSARYADTPLGQVEELLFPFGAPTDDVFDPGAVVSEFVPSWMRYATRAGLGGGTGSFATQQDVDAYNGRVIATAQWLLANDREGKYDLANPDGWLDVIADAKGEVGQIGVWQAFSAFVGPGPAQPNFFVLDDDGNVQLNPGDPNTGTFITTVTMGNLYRMQRDIAIEAGFDFEDADSIAFARVSELTGAGNLRPASIGRSRSLIPGNVPLTRAAFDWLRENPDAPDRADLTWGFFAPQEEGEFYFPMYTREIELGDRKRLTPEEWAAAGQDVLADVIYREAADEVERRWPEGAPDEAVGVLSDLRTELRTRFPGWQEEIVASRGGATQAALELGRVTDVGGVFADHELAPAIREVVEMREATIAYMKDNGISQTEVPFESSAATAPYRQFYAGKLDEFAEKYPEIAHVIDEVFRREIRAGLYKDIEREQE